MKKLFNVSDKQLGRIGIWSCLISALVGTVTNVIGAIRHDRRDKKLYATLQLKADEVQMPSMIAGETYKEE